MEEIIVSVIVPIFYGKQYIGKQIQQLENAADMLAGVKIEAIFVNDSPKEVLDDDLYSGIISIRILNTDINRGIQGARIKGLSISEGQYIHFLDQDDEITPNYYASQLNKIGDADAVYCRCYNGQRQTYTHDKIRVFETAFEDTKIFDVCPVVSPGQVLIRRDSIPKFWQENILKNIGSDDYLLWLCMYATGCKFAANQDILFTHVRNGNNYSSDVLRSKKSDDEMVNLLIDSGMFSEEDCKRLKALPEKQLVRRYEPQRKDQIVLMVLSELLSCYEKRYTLEQYFLNQDINSIAIYGAAVMGERIKGLLAGTSVTVSCFIDRNAPFIDEDIPVYEWGKVECDYDAIVISVIEREDEIIESLGDLSGRRAFTIREIVGEMSSEC